MRLAVFTVDLFIVGLDPAQSRNVERAVRQVARSEAWTDVWKISILPSSNRRNRWGLGMKGPSGWSFTWLDSPPGDLPSRVATSLERLLHPDSSMNA